MEENVPLSLQEDSIREEDLFGSGNFVNACVPVTGTSLDSDIARQLQYHGGDSLFSSRLSFAGDSLLNLPSANLLQDLEMDGDALYRNTSPVPVLGPSNETSVSSVSDVLQGASAEPLLTSGPNPNDNHRIFPAQSDSSSRHIRDGDEYSSTQKESRKKSNKSRAQSKTFDKKRDNHRKENIPPVVENPRDSYPLVSRGPQPEHNAAFSPVLQYKKYEQETRRSDEPEFMFSYDRDRHRNGDTNVPGVFSTVDEFSVERQPCRRVESGSRQVHTEINDDSIPFLTTNTDAGSFDPSLEFTELKRVAGVRLNRDEHFIDNLGVERKINNTEVIVNRDIRRDSAEPNSDLDIMENCIDLHLGAVGGRSQQPSVYKARGGAFIKPLYDSRSRMVHPADSDLAVARELQRQFNEEDSQTTQSRPNQRAAIADVRQPHGLALSTNTKSFSDQVKKNKNVTPKQKQKNTNEIANNQSRHCGLSRRVSQNGEELVENLVRDSEEHSVDRTTVRPRERRMASAHTDTQHEHYCHGRLGNDVFMVSPERQNKFAVQNNTGLVEYRWEGAHTSRLDSIGSNSSNRSRAVLTLRNDLYGDGSQIPSDCLYDMQPVFPQEEKVESEDSNTQVDVMSPMSRDRQCEEDELFARQLHCQLNVDVIQNDEEYARFLQESEDRHHPVQHEEQRNNERSERQASPDRVHSGSFRSLRNRLRHQPVPNRQARAIPVNRNVADSTRRPVQPSITDSLERYGRNLQPAEHGRWYPQEHSHWRAPEGDHSHNQWQDEGYDILPDRYREEFDPDYMMNQFDAENDDHFVSMMRDPHMLTSLLINRAPDMMIPDHIDLNNYEALWELAEQLGEVRRVGLDRCQLTRLPEVEYHEPQGVEPAETLACPVCLTAFEDGEKIKILPSCLHKFHVSCIDQWLVRNACCPVCRQEVRVG